ncbi:uncharacterized protein PAC_18466 [Phialocephala subalpina]|uniref:Uncharacterized protein n=1 Tax=Phialocephala subalpina TaxID=576137 RepID=A0A1L7XUB8_9HELO|nr:uncharacterized protein PAC_18466 [Phialocephala subalpina]
MPGTIQRNAPRWIRNPTTGRFKTPPSRRRRARSASLQPRANTPTADHRTIAAVRARIPDVSQLAVDDVELSQRAIRDKRKELDDIEQKVQERKKYTSLLREFERMEAEKVQLQEPFDELEEEKRELGMQMDEEKADLEARFKELGEMENELGRIVYGQRESNLIRGRSDGSTAPYRQYHHLMFLLIIHSTEEVDSPSMPASGIQTLLEQTLVDTVLFYDACYSADAAIAIPRSQGLTELVVACGFETVAPGPGRYSFTHSLTAVLGEMRGSPFSVSELYVPSVPVNGIQALFKESISDFVLIYDTCESAETAVTSAANNPRGIIKLISACGFRATAPSPGFESLAYTLIADLVGAAKPGDPFSVSQFYNRILARLRNSSPRVGLDLLASMNRYFKASSEVSIASYKAANPVGKAINSIDATLRVNNPSTSYVYRLPLSKGPRPLQPFPLINEDYDGLEIDRRDGQNSVPPPRPAYPSLGSFPPEPQCCIRGRLA